MSEGGSAWFLATTFSLPGDTDIKVKRVRRGDGEIRWLIVRNGSEYLGRKGWTHLGYVASDDPDGNDPQYMSAQEAFEEIAKVGGPRFGFAFIDDNDPRLPSLKESLSPAAYEYGASILTTLYWTSWNRGVESSDPIKANEAEEYDAQLEALEAVVRSFREAKARNWPLLPEKPVGR